jgi:4-hydroxy-tetrahydrodipicolinate reductase
MKIFLYGYCKMGKEIEKLAPSKGHEIIGVYDPYYAFKFEPKNFDNADLIIDYTTPGSVLYNIQKCFEANKPIVIGTTGWYSEFEYVKELCKKYNGSLFYSTNFSVGVNILIKISELLAKLMNNQDNYSISLHETHHIHKKDTPSGTAITIAETLIKNDNKLTKWESLEEGNKKEISGSVLPIYTKREGEVVGQHKIIVESNIDRISIEHEAFSRTGFATGTLIATEWLLGRKGIFTMKDLFENI